MPGMVLPASTGLEFAAGAAGTQLINGLVLLTGWAVEEPGGLVEGRLLLRDGLTSAGNVRVPIRLAAGESRSDDAPMQGVVFQRGIFLDVTTGSVTGCLFVVPSHLFRIVDGVVILGDVTSGYQTAMGVMG